MRQLYHKTLEKARYKHITKLLQYHIKTREAYVEKSILKEVEAKKYILV